jgi:hypothetical protein
MRTAYRQAKRGFPSLYGAHTAPKILGDFFPATEEPLLLSEQSRFFHLISECRIQSRPVSLGLFYSAIKKIVIQSGLPVGLVCDIAKKIGECLIAQDSDRETLSTNLDNFKNKSGTQIFSRA